MPLFEVTLSNGTTRVMQAHNKRDLRAALEGVTLTSIEERKRCRGKNEESGRRCTEAATVQGTFCAGCWEGVRTEFAEKLKDIPMSEQDLENLVISFFVEG